MPKPSFFAPGRRSAWLRAALLTLALPLCGIGLFCLLTAYKIYASNQAEKHLAPAAAPYVGQRLLVFAPHPDDETLGAAGLMRQSRLRGDDVRVVIITNGDGFRISAAQTFHELTVSPKDFVRYGYLRQGEARTALAILGVPADHVHFLGYPDRGLMPMWINHWSPIAPVASSYTTENHSPYIDAATPNAPYCGAALLGDIKAQMLAEQPTDIYVTHPNDDHPDHAAASVFVRAALEQLRAAGIPWAQTARLHYYLVHRGDWPVPQGLHEDAALLPPGPMAALDTHWTALPLTLRDTQKKYTALKRYHSQIEISSRFLYSFARQNELFGTIGRDNHAPGLAVVPDSRFHMNGSPNDWTGQTPVALDPSGDSVMRGVSIFRRHRAVIRLPRQPLCVCPHGYGPATVSGGGLHVHPASSHSKRRPARRRRCHPASRPVRALAAPAGHSRRHICLARLPAGSRRAAVFSFSEPSDSRRNAVHDGPNPLCQRRNRPHRLPSCPRQCAGAAENSAAVGIYRTATLLATRPALSRTRTVNGPSAGDTNRLNGCPVRLTCFEDVISKVGYKL